MLHLSEQELFIVKSILQQHIPYATVWAFRSRVNGHPKPYSDFDLAVITDKPLSLEVYANLKDAFSESDLPWKVDIVDWALMNKNFKKLFHNSLKWFNNRDIKGVFYKAVLS